MKEEKKQHLEFIQNTITRMNTNSFQLKNLAVTITTALLAVYASSKNDTFVFIGLLPIIMFWFLDSFYLQQERKFRGIYNDVSGITSINKISDYEMPLHKYTSREYNYINSLISKPNFFFYISLILIIVIIWILI